MSCKIEFTKYHSNCLVILFIYFLITAKEITYFCVTCKENAHFHLQVEVFFCNFIKVTKLFPDCLFTIQVPECHHTTIIFSYFTFIHVLHNMVKVRGIYLSYE